MRTFIHGTDKGNAVMTALVLIMVLSSVFMSLVPRLTAVKSFSKEYKTRIIRSIEQSNKEIMKQYDTY